MNEERRKSDLIQGERIAAIEANIDSILREIRDGRAEMKDRIDELKEWHKVHFKAETDIGKDTLEVRGIAESAERHINNHIESHWKWIALILTVSVGIAGIVARACGR